MNASDVADLNGNTAAFRLSEGLAFIEAMNQTFSQQMIYGDTSSNPDGVLGLTPRYNSLSAQSGANIIDAEITLDALPDARFRGSVARIVPSYFVAVLVIFFAVSISLPLMPFSTEVARALSPNNPM